MTLDLGIDLGIRGRGRAMATLPAQLGRELTEADIALLATERGIKPPSLTRLRDSHHALARCLARGMRGEEASIVTGYSASRISILRADPAFQDLISFYQANEEMIHADVQARMGALNLDALQELHDRLLESPSEIGTALLADIIKMLADRTGHGPATKSTNVNVNVDLASRMEQGRRRAEAARAVTINEAGDIV